VEKEKPLRAFPARGCLQEKKARCILRTEGKGSIGGRKKVPLEERLEVDNPLLPEAAKKSKGFTSFTSTKSRDKLWGKRQLNEEGGKTTLFYGRYEYH